MTTMVHIKASLIPWDDPEFVRAFDVAREATDRSGCCPDGPQAAERVQHLLHEAGFPNARIEIRQTVEEALEHVSHWSVRRDG